MGDEPTTKERLIEAASVIFAEKGYRHATVAEICQAAGANIAAVNYHFGDKANLYKEVWDYLSKAGEARFPIPESHEEVGAEEWLRLFLRSRLRRIFADGSAGLFPKLIYREMSECTPQHDLLARTYLKPNIVRVEQAIRDFMGTAIDEIRLALLTHNFMGIQISLNMGYQKFRNHPAHLIRFGSITDSEPYIRQIETFALGGLKEVRRGLTS